MSEEPIISTKERPGDYDALERAKPGEPIFTLKGGDPFAPATIIFWADLARRAGLAEDHQGRAFKLLNKASSAEYSAWAFQAYYRGEGAEVVAEQKRYESEDVTDRNVILARAAERLNNALAEALTVAESLDGLSEEPFLRHERNMIRRAVADLKEVSAAIEPRRHMRKS